jgi:hypothetical protein
MPPDLEELDLSKRQIRSELFKSCPRAPPPPSLRSTVQILDFKDFCDEDHVFETAEATWS